MNAKNPFKAGDKVKCIDNTGMEQYLQLNSVYTADDAYSDGIIIDGEYFSDTRFKLVLTMPPAGLVVENITGNLHKIVQEIFFSFGYKWVINDDKPVFFEKALDKYIFCFFKSPLGMDRPGVIYHGSRKNFESGFVILDPRKDLSKLVEHL